jgi:hypothetical protein
MRLEAVELEAVGTFADRVVVRDFAPGLNVLAGPNERGKSTWLRALLTLFLEGHRAKKQAVEDLRPYGGGAPRIACRFALGEAAWRIEKQYLAAAKAELVKVSGTDRHVGADAETELARLLEEAGDLAARLPMFWVRQGDSASLPILGDGLRHSLGDILAAEAEQSTGGAAANLVLDDVRKRLDALVTASRGQPRRGGPYARRLAERDKVRTALERAEARARQAEAWIEELTALQRREAELSDAEAAARQKAHRGRLERRLADAMQANRQLKVLGERLAFLGEQRNQRAAALGAYDTAVRERAELEAATAAAETELTGLLGERGTLDTEIDAATVALADAEAREKEHRDALDAARGAEIQSMQGARREQIDASLARLDALEAEIASLDGELATMDWPEATLRAIAEATRRISDIEVRRVAAAPALKLVYAPGRSQGFRIDGEPVEDGNERRVVAPIAIDVEDIGRIEVRPALTETRDKLEGELEHWRRRLARHLDAMQVTNPDEAAERDTVRDNRRQRRRLLVVEAETIAPAGRERLEAERAALAAGANGDVVEAPPPGAAEQAAAALERVGRERQDLAANLERMKKRRAELENRRTELATGRVMRRSRLDELAKALAGDGETDPRRELEANVAETDREIDEARRERAAFEETALPPEAAVALETEIEEAARAEAGRGEQLVAVRQDMRRIEGQLQRDFEDGPGEEANALRARLEALEAEITDVEGEIAALKLLNDQLTGETERHRREISGPLARRLAGLAATLWPDAEVALTPDLQIAHLARQGAAEAPTAISQGTHEQLAVLARIAYADMLATAGGTAPIILDDPFVYSDDGRLDKLFDVIADAAMRHQVIVLTCHARAFEPLVSRHSAKRLDFEAAAPVDR